jgi:hypothetical protein
MKKAKRTTKSTTRKPATKRRRKSNKEVDLVEVRKDIAQIVGSEAKEMALAVVDEALKGQLAPVKYLFEVSGLYPSTPATEGKPEEDSLAHRLLKHLGLPTKPVISEDDEPKPGIFGMFRVAANDEPEMNSGEVNREKTADEGETRVADDSPDLSPVNS